MELYYIFLLLGLAVLSGAKCKNQTIGIIKELGISTAYYPKGYVKPASRIRKLFKLRQSIIPRYCYIELIISIFYVVLGPINMIVFIIAGCAPRIFGWLSFIHCCLIIIESNYFIIMSLLYKYKKH